MNSSGSTRHKRSKFAFVTWIGLIIILIQALLVDVDHLWPYLLGALLVAIGIFSTRNPPGQDDSSK